MANLGALDSKSTITQEKTRLILMAIFLLPNTHLKKVILCVKMRICAKVPFQTQTEDFDIFSLSQILKSRSTPSLQPPFHQH